MRDPSEPLPISAMNLPALLRCMEDISVDIFSRTRKGDRTLFRIVGLETNVNYLIAGMLDRLQDLDESCINGKTLGEIIFQSGSLLKNLSERVKFELCDIQNLEDYLIKIIGLLNDDLIGALSSEIIGRIIEGLGFLVSSNVMCVRSVSEGGAEEIYRMLLNFMGRLFCNISYDSLIALNILDIARILSVSKGAAKYIEKKNISAIVRSVAKMLNYPKTKYLSERMKRKLKSSIGAFEGVYLTDSLTRDEALGMVFLDRCSAKVVRLSQSLKRKSDAVDARLKLVGLCDIIADSIETRMPFLGQNLWLNVEPKFIAAIIFHVNKILNFYERSAKDRRLLSSGVDQRNLKYFLRIIIDLAFSGKIISTFGGQQISNIVYALGFLVNRGSLDAEDINYRAIYFLVEKLLDGEISRSQAIANTMCGIGLLAKQRAIKFSYDNLAIKAVSIFMTTSDKEKGAEAMRTAIRKLYNAGLIRKPSKNQCLSRLCEVESSPVVRRGRRSSGRPPVKVSLPQSRDGSSRSRMSPARDKVKPRFALEGRFFNADSPFSLFDVAKDAGSLIPDRSGGSEEQDRWGRFFSLFPQGGSSSPLWKSSCDW